MRTSQLLLPTLKEDPVDTAVTSHKLMLRAGLIQQVAAGLYTWLPLGLIILRKVETIIREEMNRSGAQEILMNGVQPAELWKETNRWGQFGQELLRLKDRHNRDFCLGPTHEEVVTDLVRRAVTSYKQLPLCLYQIQTKFRDEVRPRFGVMRSREFIMKDAYSFDITEAGLNESYHKMYDAYCRIFNRIGLDYRAVLADSGAIGGTGSQEFHVLANSGEDEIMFSNQSEYAANIEKAECIAIGRREPATEKLRRVDTPTQKTIEALVNDFGIEIIRTVKTLVVRASDDINAEFVAIIIRGDHTLNEVKAVNHAWIQSPLIFATESEIYNVMGAGPGSLGPVSSPIPILADRQAALCSNFSAGANEDGVHLFGINWQRDCNEPEIADLRNAVEGDISPDGRGVYQLCRGIEVGHVFQLGQKYSESMNAKVLNEYGKEATLYMGCYGIGVTRIVAAAIEQKHDDRGICWPLSLAPFNVCIVPIGANKNKDVDLESDRIAKELEAQDVEVLLDDRKLTAGQRFADMDLIGIPIRVVVSDKTLETSEAEIKERKNNTVMRVSLHAIVNEVKSRL